MNITHGKVENINWHRRFAWLPQTFITDHGGFVTVWLESYSWRRSRLRHGRDRPKRRSSCDELPQPLVSRKA